MQIKPFLLLLLLPLTLAFILKEPPSLSRHKKDNHDTVYYNGTILTMDEEWPSARMVTVKNGRIVEVSNRTIPPFSSSKKTKYVNLRRKTMAPGFIDAHSHFGMTAVYLNQNFSIASRPFGNVTSIPQMLQNAKKYLNSNNVSLGEPIYSIGYNDYELEEHRHPTRYELDWISTDHPIVFGHYSGHAVVANSLALELVGYTENAEPPPGGVFDKYPNGTLTGLCKEYAVLPLLLSFQISFIDLTPQQIRRAEEVYFRTGVTTAHDIIPTLAAAKKYKELGNKLSIDVNGYHLIASPRIKSLKKFMTEYSTSHFKPRGAKFVVDGSIQTYTAELSKPYWVPKANQYDNLDNYTYDKNRSCKNQSCGQSNFPYASVLSRLVQEVHALNYDVIAHCNGDQAIDTFLEAVRHSRNKNRNNSESRFIAIHAQTIREDQLQDMAELRANPSFFSPHIYYWGDEHYRIFLGPERANRINPAASALQRNISFTLHNDSPVVLMGQTAGRNTFISIIESAVNRKTQNGRILGENQRISVLEALKAVTINSAWQARQEKTKGSIREGKVADFVILSDDPLTMKPQRLGELQVQATIKADQFVFGSDF